MDDINYNVMPNMENKFSTPAPLAPSQPPNFSPRNFKKWLYVGGGIVLLVLLAVLGYFILRNRNKPIEASQSRLPKVWLNQNFASETCPDAKNCGDEADPDNDGLNNYNEFKEGTNPNNPDTDNDGLADGDEVNIYKTDPGLKFTDRREIAVIKDFNDARDIADGFDPLTPGARMTETRLKQIGDDTKTFGLHEPTSTTLKNLKNSISAISAPKKSLTIADLIVSAQTCSPATADITIRQNTGAGSISIFNERSQIVGASGQNCHFVSKRIGADLILDKELTSQELSAGQTTQAEIDEFEKSLQQQVHELRKNNIGFVQDCTLSSSNLVELLKNWQSGSTSSTLSFNVQQYCKFTTPK